jgi:hypothetical protein
MPVLQTRQCPTRLFVLARWGKNRKAPNSNYRRKRCLRSPYLLQGVTVFGRHSAFIPKCQGVASTAFLIPFSSEVSLGFQRQQVKNQLDCSRNVQATL